MKEFGSFRPLDTLVTQTSLSRLYLKVTDVSQLLVADYMDQQAAIIVAPTVGKWKQGDVIVKRNGQWELLASSMKYIGAPTQLRGYKKGEMAYIQWKDPGDYIPLNSVGRVRWVNTVLVRKYGSAPSSITDGITVCTTTSKNFYNTPNGPNIQELVPHADGDSSWFYRAFAVGANGCIAGSTPMQLVDFNWTNIIAAIKAGRASEIFAPGDTLTYTDSNNVNVNIVVASIDTENSDDRSVHPHLVTFIMDYPYNRLPFDVAKGIYIGNAYYMLTRDTFYQRSKQFKYYTLANDNTVARNIQAMPGTPIPRNKDIYEMVSGDRGQNGTNIWADSDIHEWLNLRNVNAESKTLTIYRAWMTDPSNGCVGIDIPMNYIRNLDNELASAITSTVVHTGASTSTDTFFLPSWTELTGKPVSGNMEGTQFQLYRDMPNLNHQYIVEVPGQDHLFERWNWLTRSAATGDYKVMIIDDDKEDKYDWVAANTPQGVVIAFSIG